MKVEKNILTSGSVYNRWTVLSKAQNENKIVMYLCRCVCGVERTVRKLRLLNGESKSCGCLANELSSTRNSTHGDSVGEIHYLYIVWSAMKNRIFNKNYHCYENYGGRGITMFSEWVDDYSKFKNWILINIGEKPNCTMSIDRIDSNGNYAPGNLRWATPKTQSLNRDYVKLAPRNNYL